MSFRRAVLQQPGLRFFRHALRRPLLQSGGEGFAQRILRSCHVASGAAREEGEKLRVGVSRGAFDGFMGGGVHALVWPREG
jgi:hypothetical protein